MQNIQGYDTEIIDVNKDFLDRKRLATNIFKTINDTPNDWSIRIGLYGKWGEGKTTLLHYLKQSAEATHYPYIPFRISIYSNPNELWSAFLVTLLEGLHRLGYDIKNALTFSWLPDWSVGFIPIECLLRATSIAQNVNKSINHSLTNSALQLIMNHLKIDSCFLHDLEKQLNGKKIIFAIDDFDRLPPELVPQFLIALREILNLPCFAFILAMDRDMIANAIHQENKSYGTGHSFLEKIIDFPYTLPEPTAKQVETIFKDQLANIVNINSNIDCSQILQYLPKNPRKLKLVSRNIKILKDELLRHGEEEIKWEIILFLCVLRSKSQHAHDIIAKQLTNDDLYAIMLIEDDKKKAEAIKEKIDAIKQNCKDIAENDHELTELLKYFFQNYYYFKTNNLYYFANLIVKPHFLTWKEFKILLDEHNKTNSDTCITEWIKATQKSRNQKNQTKIAEELFESSINYYSDCLAKAADSELTDEHKKFIKLASDTLSFIKALFLTIDEYNEKEFFQFFDKMLVWQNFQRNKEDSNLRERELETTKELLRKLKNLKRIEIFHGLMTRSKNLSDHPFGEENDQPKLDFVTNLMDQVTDILNELHAFFEKTDAIRHIKSSKGNTALGYLLLSNESILFKNGNIEKLDEIIPFAGSNIIIYSNLKEYLNIFCEHVSHQQLKAEIIKMAAPILWKAAISRELQYRFHSKLLEQRQLLINAGIKEELLALPPWLSTTS